MHSLRLAFGQEAWVNLAERLREWPGLGFHALSEGQPQARLVFTTDSEARAPSESHAYPSPCLLLAPHHRFVQALGSPGGSYPKLALWDV